MPALSEIIPVQALTLSPAKLAWIWARMEGRPSEFSEFVAPDPEAFRAAIFSDQLLWYEFPDADTERTKGLVAVRHDPTSTEATLFVTMLDKRPGEKVEGFRAFCREMFATLPIHRLTMEVPDVHFALKRLIQHAGWRREGTKREAVRLPGRWVNVGIHGLLREES